ncbi:MAG: histidine phosphatase family protein [Chloroflexota bacterium]|jgi:2,3-bisphosphoglycerate-dependent phosphoglycerate mutase
MSEIWFIRHGESVSNADLPTSHPAESELTPEGWAEAERVAQAFTTQPDLLVVSPYIRAQQTAVATQNRFEGVPTATWPVHEYTYLAARHYDGTTGSERWPIAMTYWERSDPHYRDDPEAETFAELVSRVWTTIERLHQTSAPFVAIFSHGLFIRALLWAVLTGTHQPGPEQMKRYSSFCLAVNVPNGAICRLYLDESGPRLGSIDTSHLRETG